MTRRGSTPDDIDVLSNPTAAAPTTGAAASGPFEDVDHEAGAVAPAVRTRALARVGNWLWHVLLLVAWMLILASAAATWGPRFTDYKTDVIIGRSMEPTIPLYSVIVVEPIKPEQIKVGDVITYQNPDSPKIKVTHRVAKVSDRAGKPLFKTKGDNNDVQDPYSVNFVDDAYIVRHHVPHLGWLLLKAQQKEARLLLVVAPIGILLVWFLIWLWRDEDEAEHDDSYDATEARA